MVDELGPWKWNLFERMVPVSVLLRIAAVKVSRGLQINDQLCWGLTSNKQFKLSTAYACPALNLSADINFAKDGTHWDMLFGFIVWNLWCRRNEWIFGEHNVRYEYVLLRSQRMQREAVATMLPSQAITATGRATQIHPAAVDQWMKPSGGWCKLNIDWVVNRVSGLASCGGVIRDEEGTWLLGFSKKIGKETRSSSKPNISSM
ncbi:hypothetical protein V6N11_024235 [Hibiscus sabdariffa]|uniref:RNase H type-1 domain-containing protein n=2 Tax=Hibiscus sabdariffa TaxID=183260 RepID=A0ABR2A9N0_9ROSI